jgi:hypothetical protein
MVSLGLIGMAISGTAHADPVRSPGDVRTALRLMMQVSNDFARQIDRKTFNRLPHENQEFHEASDALRQAVKDDPASFRARVEKKLVIVVARAQSIADESATASEPKLRLDHKAMVQDLHAVFDAFPTELHPDPNVQPGGGPRPQ